MGSMLLDAAANGDTEFLKKFYNDNGNFLSETDSPNLLHAAVENNRYTFLFEALDLLSSNPTLIIKLICHEFVRGNPLHCAVETGNIFVLKLLVTSYTKAVSAAGNNYEVTPPWLAKASSSLDFTPLRYSLGIWVPIQENIARYLVSVDAHWLKTLGQSRYPMDQCSTMNLDKYHRSIVFIGMQRGYSLLVMQILDSNLPYSLSGQDNETPLHYASKCNDQVSKKLLEKHPELISRVSSSGNTILDQAVDDGTTWLLRLFLLQEKEKRPWTRACGILLWHVNQKGDTPLHTAARKGEIAILEILIQAFHSLLREETGYCDNTDALPQPGNDRIGLDLFHVAIVEDHIPLVLALQNKHDHCGLMLLEETFPSMSNSSFTAIFKKSLPIAVVNGCLLSAKKIIERALLTRRISELIFILLEFNIGDLIALCIARHITSKYPEQQEMFKAEEFDKIVELLPRFLGETQMDTRTLLKDAVERGDEWFLRLVLQTNFYAIYKESAAAWQLACEMGNKPFLLLFLETCDCEMFIELCKKEEQTPLHHLKFLGFEEYVELLKMPVLEKLKNQRDIDGATPLHRAIERHDINLSKALLETDGIDISIKDNNGTTALDLLEKSCKVSPRWLEEYIGLFEIPTFENLLNHRDKDGATSLHRAIQCDHLDLVKALLETKGIDLSIKDNKARTALDLLQKNCGLSPSWGKMCMEIKQDSTVKQLKYLFRKISFEGIQNTMSVVSALVTTLSFAAGFTVPGGTNSENGTPVLAKKTAFLVFSVSNTIAMCCSVMVLFLLLGPKMWDPHPSVFYINLSLLLLLMSIGGTMVAFVAGVYATMVHKAEWFAIFLIVSCSLAFGMASLILMLTSSSRVKKLVHKLFTLPQLFSLPQFSDNTTSVLQSVKKLLSKPFSCLQKISKKDSSTLELLPVIQTSDNTSANVLQSANLESGSSNTLLSKVSSSLLTEKQTTLSMWEVGQSSGTSHPPSEIENA